MFTQAMQNVIGIAMEMCLVRRSPEETVQFLRQNQAVIHEGIQDALDRAAEDTVTALTLIDTAKMLGGRDRLFRRRMADGTIDSTRAIMIALTKPEFAEKFLHAS